MKKVLFLILAFSIPAWAGINVTQGSGKTVHTDTVGGDEYQAVKIIDGTTGGTSSATVTSVGLRVDLATTSVVTSTIGVSSILGALPAGSNSLGNVNITSTNTLPVSGTFFQATQPVQGTVNVISTQPFTIYGTTVQVVNTTVTIQNIQNALPGGSNSIGTVLLSTVQVVNTTTAVSAIQGALPPGSNSLGNVNVLSTTTLAANVFPSSSTFGGSVYQGVLLTTNSVVVSSAIYGYSNVNFTVYPGTTTNEVVVFEVSPDSGTNWFPEESVQSGTDIISSSYTLTTTTTNWITANLSGETNFRVRAANWQVGIASVTLIPVNLPVNRYVSMGLIQIGTQTVLTQGTTGAMPVAGAYAANVGTYFPNPVLVGGYAFTSSNPTPFINGRIANLSLDGFGRTITQGGAPNSIISRSTATLTTTTETVLISSAGASTFTSLCGCLATNTSATNTFLTFRDGGGPSNGTTAFTLGVPANDVPAGFGPLQCDHEIPQKTANANWTVQANNAVTDIRLTCWYFQSL